MPFLKLLEAVAGDDELNTNLNAFYPVQDQYLLDPIFPVDYLTSMKTGNFSKVPIMTGTVLYDGAVYLPKENFGNDWNKHGAHDLYITSSFNKSEISDEEVMQAALIKRFYTGKENKLSKTLHEAAEMVTDAHFLSPDQKVAELASKHVPVYNYR